MNSENFEEFFITFTESDLAKKMRDTHENSPWHREESVWVHTQMLLDWYMTHFWEQRSSFQRALTLTACLFHDAGKPAAEETKFSEERGEYRSYHGHELISARLWTDYALTHRDLIGRTLELRSLVDIANIALMIEYHVPFGLKDQRKRYNLKLAFHNRMGVDGHQAWLDLLDCDQNGRIADDQQTKLAAVAAWKEEWGKIGVNV